MRNNILVVSENQELISLCRKTNSDFIITCAGTPEDALAALAIPEQFAAVLADARPIGSDIDDFFKKVAQCSSAVPLMAADTGELAKDLELVNRLGIFRLLPLPCGLELLEAVLYDATRQFTLILRERDLRKKVRELSTIDSLTGCFTRNVFQQRLPQELQRSILYAHHLSIILCDIDKLCRINDSYGHRIGDRILTGVAQVAREIFRGDVDWITRWGDDEFLIVLPETPIRGAGIVAERLRLAVAELQIPSGDNIARATISIGITGYSPEEPNWNNTFDNLLLVAENCLNHAKEEGGNQVLVCPFTFRKPSQAPHRHAVAPARLEGL
jgi:diguanylate cyclase (GGDEF)-like protein